MSVNFSTSCCENKTGRENGGGGGGGGAHETVYSSNILHQAQEECLVFLVFPCFLWHATWRLESKTRSLAPAQTGQFTFMLGKKEFSASKSKVNTELVSYVAD